MPRLAACSAIVVVVLGVVGCYQITRTVYFHQLTSVGQHRGIAGVIAQNVAWRLREFGEITLNMPQSKAPNSTGAVFSIVGAVVLTVFMWGLWSRKKAVGSTEVYLATYMAILFVWPFYDARFWLPVIPLLIGFVWIGGVHAHKLWSAFQKCSTPILCVQLMCFLILATVALVYSTRITFAGRRFPERYGDGTLLDTYRAAYGQPHDQEKVDQDALRLLKRYGSMGR